MQVRYRQRGSNLWAHVEGRGGEGKVQHRTGSYLVLPKEGLGVRMQKGKRNTLLEDKGILSITGKIVIVAENLASLCSTIVERA